MLSPRVWLELPQSPEKDDALKAARQLLSRSGKLSVEKAKQRDRAAAFAEASPADALLRCIETVKSSPSCVLASFNLAAVAWAVLRAFTTEDTPEAGAGGGGGVANAQCLYGLLGVALSALAAAGAAQSHDAKLSSPPLSAERLFLGPLLLSTAHGDTQEAVERVSTQTQQCVAKKGFSWKGSQACTLRLVTCLGSFPALFCAGEDPPGDRREVRRSN